MSGWTLAEMKAEDGAYMVRARTALPDPADRARYPVAIWVTWSWGSIASEAEEDAILTEMIAFEDAVHRASERGGWGMLTAVVTNGAAREWLWYAADRAEFIGEMRGALEAHPSYPFEVRAWDDPLWKVARELNPRAAMH